MTFNPFLAYFAILYTLKTQKNRFFTVFRGYKMRTLGRNWLVKEQQCKRISQWVNASLLLRFAINNIQFFRLKSIQTELREPSKRKNQRQQSIPKDIRPVDFPPTVSNDPFLSSVYGGSSTGIKSKSITSINCMVKVNNKNNRRRCKIYPKLIIKTRERRQNAQENT